ncbi:MAG: DNA polymerase III subunit chi [Betaproteobacteria bacterium]|nr:DNA polymerase III subunit chi [Betaproteobacteria bacterium]MDE2423418.1 DNA polymerase III subunit chi [Betaproteobacteria bacterium]
MTRIDFYTHVDNQLLVTQKLIEKAWQQKKTVWVRAANQSQADAIDQGLWQISPTSVIPHCLSDDPLAKDVPIVIDANETTPWHYDCLVNLHPQHNEYFARFQRLLEVVSTDEQDKQHARLRFQHYRSRGFEIYTHDLSRK